MCFTCFNMRTGEIVAESIEYSKLILQMYEGWTPYYARDGRYVGCCCYVSEYKIERFYNPVSSEYVKSYEELAW